jgi:MoxR-like ATPase
MSDEIVQPIEEKEEQGAVQLEGGTYEVIKGRLNAQAAELRGRLGKLNVERKDIFGAVELRLKGNARINTENNCIAKDIFSIGNICLFGYNVHIGLRSETKLSDVFSFYEFDGEQFKDKDINQLGAENPRFLEEFQNMHKFYKDAVFTQFALDVSAPYMYMIFRLSSSANDIKTFKWEIGNNKLRYVIEPGEHKYTPPKQYDFEWKRATRDMFREGRHPHVSILDRVFVETVGGDLTIKVEDNTETGLGIYAEPVALAEQRLDDAEVYFADLGSLILLRVKPYQENTRYFVFNEKMQNVQRIDALAFSGILLPGGQGLIFSNGFYLQTGDFKMFDKAPAAGYRFERKIASPNGEDHLYIYFSDEKLSYLLLSYNIITQSVATPIFCNGYSLYSNGELTYFRAEETATKHHIIQIWQTPYVEGDILPSKNTDSFLYKIGNRDIVRAMAEMQELLSMIGKDDNYSGLYYDLTKKTNDILDSYYWINSKESYSIDESLKLIRQSATSAIDEYEKVQSIKRTTRQTIRDTQGAAEVLFKEIGQTTFSRVDTFVQILGKLRVLRGEIISLRDLRYTDLEVIATLENRTIEFNAELSANCVSFLLRADALQPYLERVDIARKSIDEVQTAKQGKKLEDDIDAIGKELELLVEIVTNLKIDDPTQTTKIIDSITTIFATLNQVKAAIRRRLRDLTGAEAVTEFAAQMRLLEQGMLNFLDISDTPAKCDEYRTKLMVQMEEVESKFAEFDEFTVRITEKREEVFNAFDARKLQLTEAINRRTSALQTAAERILSGVKNRAYGFKEVAQINGFFAADMMIEKVREIIENLNKLGDSNKAGDIQTQLKTIKEEAIRQLRDKQELFSEGGDVIRLGKHLFSVNKQPLELTMVYRNNSMYYHLTGTGFFEEVTNADFLRTRPVWEQANVSENQEVYRAEYLAYLCYQQIKQDRIVLQSDQALQYVQQFSATRYQEGYSKGIHDEDAAKILNVLYFVGQNIDLLYYPAQVRACASLYWNKFVAADTKELYHKQLKTAGTILRVFPKTREFQFLKDNLRESLLAFAQSAELFAPSVAERAADYLFTELSRRDYFIVSGEAYQLKKDFKAFLDGHAALKHFQDSIHALDPQPIEQYQQSRKWVQAFIDETENQEVAQYVDEVALLVILQHHQESHVVSTQTKQSIANMFGSHNVVKEGGVYEFEFNQFSRRLEHFAGEIVPTYERFQAMKKELVDTFRAQLRLEEFKPKPLTSFVRNKLIDTLYIPLFGDNFAKQIGTAGDTTRTDRMGMLLLISPPGYGKTTLVEYVADRLGLIFMKINGPAIGHNVVSLDPSEAKNAAARKELEKLNLALEMGDNILIYLDDIQHCNPEFLQKFISLTDGQRKIEGVYKGVTKTYDLRGKRVCVAMAGNPYTESGDKFQIPDMLANRSDIYNLGDIIGDSKAVFEMSYIENSMTSNAILQNLAAKSTRDIYPLLKYAETDSKDGLEFEANHSSQELSEYVEVIRRMMKVRDTLLKVNLEYIRSAAMADEYRTEPSFKLQGSYRNMNKLTEKIVPIMNEEEMTTLVVAHYSGESQTLTTGAESNMLKLKEMMGVQTPEEQARWKEIKETFLKNKLLNGSSNDPVVQVVAQLSSFSDGLRDIQKAITISSEAAANKPTQVANTGVRFKK